MDLNAMLTFIKLNDSELARCGCYFNGKKARKIRFYNGRGDIGTIVYFDDNILKCSMFVREGDAGSLVTDYPDVPVAMLVKQFF